MFGKFPETGRQRLEEENGARAAGTEDTYHGRVRCSLECHKAFDAAPLNLFFA